MNTAFSRCELQLQMSVQLVPDATEGHHRISLLSRDLCESSRGRLLGESALFSQLPERQQRASDAGLHALVVPWIWHQAAIQRPQHNLLGVVLLSVGQALHQRISVIRASAAPRITKEIHRLPARAFWQLLVPFERPGPLWHRRRGAAAVSLWCHGGKWTKSCQMAAETSAFIA